MNKWIKNWMLLSSCFLLGACSMPMNQQKKDEMKMEEKEKTTMEDTSMNMTDEDKDVSQVVNFELKDIDGNLVKRSDFEGQKVVLKLWASWCPICLATLEDSDKLAEKDTDYKFISIVSPGHNNEKSKADFVKWYKKFDYKHLPVLMDEQGDLIEQFNVRGYPTMIILNERGEIEQVLPGHLDQKGIERLIQNK
ncbi:redoxin domain-containing protein [Atopobacter phocae]|uniref:redoxin domain-containing protein n=1 Tax=Atopobacter phocae TaxID=136492 RepID=UPI0004B8CC11|nr:redoxin domain-containing protein [Atopobacter phocae]